MTEAVKIAVEATLIALLFILALFWGIGKLRRGKDFCVYCGDPSQGDFCCDAHENLFYSIDEDVGFDEDNAELDLILREERKGKAGL